MALFELNCYGENDQIVKAYETDRLRYGVVEEAIKAADALAKVEKENQALVGYSILKPFVSALFPGLTDKDLRLCDIKDIENLMLQVAGRTVPLAQEAAEGNAEGKN